MFKLVKENIYYKYMYKCRTFKSDLCTRPKWHLYVIPLWFSRQWILWNYCSIRGCYRLSDSTRNQDSAKHTTQIDDIRMQQIVANIKDKVNITQTILRTDVNIKT